MDRRTFIKGTAAVAATAVLPLPAFAEPELSGVAIAQRYLASLPLLAPYGYEISRIWFDMEHMRMEIEEITGISDVMVGEQRADEEFMAGEQWTAEDLERMRRGRA